MTLNELKILLALHGSERLEYAEEEIFSDVELYTWYLERLCSKYGWYTYYRTTPCWVVFFYTTDIIKGPWPEAEQLILADTRCTFRYARDVIKGRWFEAEPFIATDREQASWYNRRFKTSI